MTTDQIALAAHLLGVFLWLGGAVAAATVAAYGAEQGDGKVALQGARRALLWWASPGMLLAWAGGLTMLIPHFTDIYARAGWMHGKLTLLLVASAVTGVLTARIRKAANGDKPATAGLLNGLGIGLVVIGLLVLGLVIFKPGA